MDNEICAGEFPTNPKVFGVQPRYGSDGLLTPLLKPRKGHYYVFDNVEKLKRRVRAITKISTRRRLSGMFAVRSPL
jgi:hypothetical protein